MPSLHLIPQPRSTRFTRGAALELPPQMFVMLQAHECGHLRDIFAAERFIIDGEALTNSAFHIAMGDGVDPAQEIRVVHDQTIGAKLSEAIRPQAYRLTIGRQGIQIAAAGAPGAFYGFQTLLQILREAVFTANGSSKGRKKTVALPALTIEDWPDFPRRGVYHDTARGKVPTIDTLLQLIDDLGHLKYNEFQLYIENNFQFRKYPEMYDDTTPFTAEDLLLLDAACRARHIDFVPSLTSLGHFEKILSRPTLRHLAEAEPAQLRAMNATCWSDSPWSLSVTDPAAKELLKDMYAEFVPNFSSCQFNICCDEAYDLGKVRSKALADKIGTGQMYVDWINFCADLSRAHGKSIQMWGDIILNHPDLIGKLPPDVVLLEWGYEHDHKFDEHCALFAQRLEESSGGKSRRSFYVCPGTTTWLTLAGRSKNAFGNIHNGASAGLKYGATGLLVTDWGDLGHQQMFSLSLLPFAYGACASWNLASVPNPAATAPKSKDAAAANILNDTLTGLSFHLFQDPAGQFAVLVYDLGLMYERFSWQRFNASLDWWLFREKWDFANYVNRAQMPDFPKVIAACKKLIPHFRQAGKRLLHPEGERIAGELIFTCHEEIHTCRRTALRKAWLAAAPATRNPEEESLRKLPPKPLPKSFKREMQSLRSEVEQLKGEFARLWLQRNKRSRMDDVLTEFDRLAREYRQFASAR